MQINLEFIDKHTGNVRTVTSKRVSANFGNHMRGLDIVSLDIDLKGVKSIKDVNALIDILEVIRPCFVNRHNVPK